MKYHNITKDDMLNGDGLRVVLWTAGCSHKCENCQNPITWDPDYGIEFDDAAKEEIFSELEKDYISGITFSGGDPMYDTSVETVIDFAKEIKSRFPDKTIWFYTGYTWEQLISDSRRKKMLEVADVVVEGPYIDRLRDTTLYWRGSSNQRVVDIKKSLNENQVVLYCK